MLHNPKLYSNLIRFYQDLQSKTKNSKIHEEKLDIFQLSQIPFTDSNQFAPSTFWESFRFSCILQKYANFMQMS